MLICTTFLLSIGCRQDDIVGEYPNKIIVKDNLGKQVDITSKKEIENFDNIIKCEDWKELDGIEEKFNSDISIIEEYKSSKNKSRKICFDKESKHIKLIIDGKYTTSYKVEAKIYDKIHDSILDILYNDYKVD